ncbi:hypothetical protein [Streptomyces sp. NBC_01465]|uniref:hypothetical protein n=1 Tax=Streptomyces sp. NBC_01465 TaxID=2903878 RepID=UPI002E30D16C|nr:hypothetical protein [Streptomyces sp. NBC_01465]
MSGLLEAGAVLPLGGGVDADAGDVLTARAYGHSVLDGRTVVRLVPEALGPAEDLSLEYLGFAAESSALVGRVKRQSLGFPAWALVHDPANGHHALAVVKEMERLARMVASKPGNAKDGFDEIAGRLDRSVPQFLPTYYEQVARLFLAAESVQQASAFFGKARAAEQRHALVVDEERLREVFLEFAGAGALSGKALRDHAKGLAERLSAQEAYAQFRSLSVERCAAGLAPYAGMLEDLRRLARKTGLDARAEERELLAEIIHSGAMNRAAASFWTAALPALAEVAGAEQGVRERLLALFPSAGGDSPEVFDAAWLGLLDRCGAIGLLEDGTVPAAAWLEAWAKHRKRGWRQTKRLAGELSLVERLSARLIADGTPVQLVSGRGWREAADLDLLDTALAAGVPVADPSARSARLQLDSWIQDDGEGRRDLVALTSDPRFAALMKEAVKNLSDANGQWTGPSQRLQRAAEYPALRAVIAAWLRDRAEEVGRPIGLPGLRNLLRDVALFASPSVLATAPAAVRRIVSFDPAPVLGRSLRAGVYDELGWPALDEALNRVSAASGKKNFHGVDAWPALGVRAGLQVALAGPAEVLDDRALNLPAPTAHRDPLVRYVDGQWLTASWADGGWKGTWSGRPADVFKVTGSLHGSGRVSLAMPGGGRSYGGRPVHAGDTSFAEQQREIAFDTISYWVLHDGSWYEYDPETARRGRASVPAFFDSALVGAGAGVRLAEAGCRLLPVQPGLEDSPFGSKDGMLGWSVTYDENTGTHTACSVDGTRGLPVTAGIPVAPLRMPGKSVLHPVRSHWSGEHIELRDTDGVVVATLQEGDRGSTYTAGSRFVPPLWYWHALRPRDERGSAALRSVSDTDAAALLAAVEEGLTAAEAVARVLPAITDEALVAGVAGVVQEAVRCAERLGRLAEKAVQGEASPAAPVVRHATDGLLSGSLNALLDNRGAHYGFGSPDYAATTAVDQLHVLRQVLRVPPPSGDETFSFGATRVEWRGLAGVGLAAAALRAVHPVMGEKERAALVEFLTAALDCGEAGDSVLADPRGRLRSLVLSAPSGPAGVGTVRRDGQRVVLITAATWRPVSGQHWCALEYDPAGQFGPWEGWQIQETQVHGAPDDPVRAPALRRLLAVAAERGPVPFRPEQVTEFAEATGVDTASALLMLLGLPGHHAYGRNDLPGAEWLTPLGLKATHVGTARESLGQMGAELRRRLVGLLVPEAPEQVDGLWERGFDLGPVIDGWIEARGKQRPVPQELLDRAVREGLGAMELQLALNPKLDARLWGRTVQRLKDGVMGAEEPGKLLDLRGLSRIAVGLRWLAYRLPYGDPLREVLPETLRAVRERMADPGLLFQIDQGWAQPGQLSLSERIREACAMPGTGGANAEGLVSAGPALVLGPTRYSGEYGRETVWLRPAALLEDGVVDHSAVKLVLAASEQLVGLRAVRALLGERFAELVGAGGAEGSVSAPQDPGVSVPGLVSEAAARFGLSDDAATLYLMLLALPDPTDRNQALWTGWKPARLKKARAELAATELVVEAKRSRAGRSLFLPGGWVEVKSPRLPWESWKSELLPARGEGVFVVPDCPVAVLYARAWQRVVEGDVPGFEEFTGRESRRGGRR